MARLAPTPAMIGRLASLATGLVPVTWALLVVGASVRVNGAGLACPDWPLCFGEVIPPIDLGIAFEFGHRVLAGGVSLGFLALLVGMVAHRRDLPRWLLGAAGISALILTIQIVLGGLTVLHLLAEWTVASHLVTGNAFCVSLLVLALGLREQVAPVERAAVGGTARAVAALLALAVPAQLVLGGLVSASHAGLVCGATWPECGVGTYFPTFDGAVGLHVTHRLLAYVILVLGGAAVMATVGRARRAAWLVLAAIALQATVGIANVLLAVPVEITLLHSFGAASVALGLTLLHWELWRAPAHGVMTPAPSGTIPTAHGLAGEGS